MVEELKALVDGARRSSCATAAHDRPVSPRADDADTWSAVRSSNISRSSVRDAHDCDANEEAWPVHSGN
jgi:hypothetical protein